MPRKKQIDQYEAAIQELEKIVATLEHGDQSLQDSLKAYERGVELTRFCQKTLEEAEQKVQILSGQGENASLEPFEPQND